MDTRYKWATEEIFGSEKEWNIAFESLSKKIDFSEFKGKLSNKEVFLACMKKQESVFREVDKLSVYAMMKHDENTKDAKSDALLSKVTSLGAILGANCAFIGPELTALDDKILNGFIADKD